MERLSFRCPGTRGRHVRKRRFPLPRQTRGLDLDALISYGRGEPVAAATVTEIESETSRSRYRTQRVLWICAVILGLILFGDWVVRFFREAPFAWPSINGKF